MDIFFSPYGFKLPSSVFSFHLQDSLEPLCMAGLVVMNTLNFVWEYLNFSFTFEGQFCEILDSWLSIFFFVSTLNIFAHCVLASKVSGEKSVCNLMEDSLDVMTLSLLLSRFSVFSKFDYNVCLCGSLNSSYLEFAELPGSVFHVFFQIWEVFGYYFFNYSLSFFSPYLLLLGFL